MRTGVVPGCAVALCSCLVASAAAADIDAARVDRLLRAAAKAAAVPSVRHPLAETDGRIPLMVRLPAGVRAEDRGLLDVAPGFGAIRLHRDALALFVKHNPDLRPVASPPRHTLIDAATAWDGAEVFREELGIDGTGVVIGIIDTGIDAAHRDFIGSDLLTRIAWMINRQDPVGLYPELEKKYGCTDPDQSPCAVFGASDINSLLLFNLDGAPRDFDGHGTHVTSLAAGNGGIADSDDPRYAGIAPGATLIIASPSGGGGFSDPDIVRAAKFVFEQAEAMGMPAVVNVSLGSDFGPHDGTSALEQGLAALLGPPGRVMVVAAGNSGAIYPVDDQGPFGVHTEAHVSPNAVTRVTIQQPGASGEISGSGFVWVNFRPGDEVSVGLEGPDGAEWIGLVAPGDDAGYEDGSINAGVINNVVDDRSELTPETNGAIVFWDGSWQGDTARFAVLLKGEGDAQLWITGLGGAGQGGGTLGLSFERALKTGTVSVPASHPDLIAVGCTLNRSSWRPWGSIGVLEIESFGGMAPIVDSVCYFSGAGPTPSGGMKPDILAPGGFVAGAMSRDADPRTNPNSIFAASSCPDPARPCYLVDDTHALTSGTSMSSPQVAGAAALLLQMDPTLTQTEVRELLQAGARRPTGAVDYEYQGGPGALSLVGVLSALDDKAQGKLAADVSRSWYVLASPYLRPDPDWKVSGTIELRRADASIAHGIDARHLEVRVQGGIVAERPVMVRGGLYRFAVAAPRGSGGTDATVEVFYDGQSLGKRELPVGVDAWAAAGGVKAVGACAHAPARGPSGALAWWGLAALLAWRLRAGRDRDSTTGSRRRTSCRRPR